MKIDPDQSREKAKQVFAQVEALEKELWATAEAFAREAARVFNRCYDLRQKLRNPRNYVAGSEKVQ